MEGSAESPYFQVHGAAEQGDEADEARGGTGRTKGGAATCVPPLRGGTHPFAAYPRCWADSEEGSDETPVGRGPVGSIDSGPFLYLSGARSISRCAWLTPRGDA